MMSRVFGAACSSMLAAAFVFPSATNAQKAGDRPVQDGTNVSLPPENELSPPASGRQRWDAAAAEEDAAKRRVLLYRIESHDDGTVSYRAPDGWIYKVKPSTVTVGARGQDEDQNGIPRLAFDRTSDLQGTLYFSIATPAFRDSTGYAEPSATLLHAEDDHGDQLYEIGVDMGNQNDMQAPHVILNSWTKKHPEVGPLYHNRVFYLMVVWPTRAEREPPITLREKP